MIKIIRAPKWHVWNLSLLLKKNNQTQSVFKVIFLLNFLGSGIYCQRYQHFFLKNEITICQSFLTYFVNSQQFLFELNLIRALPDQRYKINWNLHYFRQRLNEELPLARPAVHALIYFRESSNRLTVTITIINNITFSTI